MSDSDSSSQKSQKIVRQRSNKSIPKQVSLVQPPPLPKPTIEDSSSLYDQNRKLRRRLKQLSIRLDEELQKAAENKLKQGNQKNGHPVSLQSHGLQLQNAYKMIQRLQRAVKDYQSKESYQVTLKRVMDLEGIIKKKEVQIEQLKTEVKTLKKINKEKDRYIEQLIQNSQKMGNPTEDLQTIKKLKLKLKKVAEENQILKKKELQKHDQLVKAQRRIVEMEQNQNEVPVGREDSLLKEIEDCKNKYKEAMQRVQRQNIYISKLNEKLNQDGSRKSERLSDRNNDRKNVASKSMDGLPQLKKKIHTSQLLQHLPTPKPGIKLRRY